MTRAITFAFIREGNSDDGLIPHLRTLIVRAGAASAIGTPLRYHGNTKSKLTQLAADKIECDLLFIHRDSDAPDDSTVRSEIAEAVHDSGLQYPVVSVVPVQELEAWLLVDEQAIREIAGKPSGKMPLGLPKVKAIENTTSPKEVLRNAYAVAGEVSGARYKRHMSLFGERAAILLDRLDPDGAVCDLESWHQLVEETFTAVRTILDAEGGPSE